MNEGWVKSINERRYLGVLISEALKFSRQFLMAKNKAKSMLAIINRKVLYKSSEIISKLYRSYVKPLRLLYTIWNVDMLEGVQSRATKMIPSLRNLKIEKIGYVFKV